MSQGVGNGVTVQGSVIRWEPGDLFPTLASGGESIGAESIFGPDYVQGSAWSGGLTGVVGFRTTTHRGEVHVHEYRNVDDRNLFDTDPPAGFEWSGEHVRGTEDEPDEGPWPEDCDAGTAVVLSRHSPEFRTGQELSGTTTMHTQKRRSARLRGPMRRRPDESKPRNAECTERTPLTN